MPPSSDFRYDDALTDFLVYLAKWEGGVPINRDAFIRRRSGRGWKFDALVKPCGSGQTSAQVYPTLEHIIGYCEQESGQKELAESQRHRLMGDLYNLGLFSPVPATHRLAGLIDWIFDPELKRATPGNPEGVAIQPDFDFAMVIWRLICQNADDTLMRVSMALFELHSLHWRDPQQALKFAIIMGKTAITHGYYRETIRMLTRAEQIFLPASELDGEAKNYYGLTIRRIKKNAEAGFTSIDRYPIVLDDYVQIEAIANDQYMMSTRRQSDWRELVEATRRGAVRSTFRHCIESHRLREAVPWDLFERIKGMSITVSPGDPRERCLDLDTQCRRLVLAADHFLGQNDRETAQIMLEQGYKFWCVLNAEVGKAAQKERRLLREAERQGVIHNIQLERVRCGIFYRTISRLTEAALDWMNGRMEQSDDKAVGILRRAYARIQFIATYVGREHFHHLRPLHSNLETLIMKELKRRQLQIRLSLDGGRL
ncbi:MAG TPA: hypothetical protein VHE55_15255 [Fimbriimonadaceae bacterium]|nr:hypothetical protein [Fimbriimonadaceae bacterium]